MTDGANRLTPRATLPADTRPPMPALQFRAFVDAFDRLGYDTTQLLTSCGVGRTTLADPDGDQCRLYRAQVPGEARPIQISGNRTTKVPLDRP